MSFMASVEYLVLRMMETSVSSVLLVMLGLDMNVATMAEPMNPRLFSKVELMMVSLQSTAVACINAPPTSAPLPEKVEPFIVMLLFVALS